MTRRSINVVEFWLKLGFFSIPIFAFGAAGYIRFHTKYFTSPHFGQPGHVDTRPYVILTAVITLLWIFAVEHLDLDRMNTILRIRTGIRMSLLATTYCVVLVLAALFFYRTTTFARFFVVVGCALMFILSLGMIHVFRGIIYAVTKHPNGKFSVAIAGADEVAAQVARQLSQNQLTPCKVACFVTLPGQTPTIKGVPVLEWHRLADALEIFQCTEVLLALPLDRLGEAHTILDGLQRLSIPARLVLHLGQTSLLPDRIFDFYGVPLVDLRACPSDSIGYAIGKRVFDFVFSAAALLLLSPLIGLIALAVKLSSSGPVFFVQDRVGLSGKLFRMYKFRTMMVSDCKQSDTQWTIAADPRRTRIGTWLRQTSLDELPQFLNVLKGDMSVVGPRPERPHFVQEFLNDFSQYNNRHYLKVGITGWAQVNGWRGDTSIQKRIEFDLYYLRNWSMAFDFKIIFLTLVRGLISRNAY